MRHRKPKAARQDIPFRLVRVEGEDSARPISEWQWVDEYQLPKIVRCVSVGYLIAEDADAIAVAPNVGDITNVRIQASGIIRVPRSAVRRIANI